MTPAGRNRDDTDRDDPDRDDPAPGDGTGRGGDTGTDTAGLPGDVGGLSYEQARDELADTVRRLESGGVGLEESLRLWERGEALVTVCQRWLDGARARLETARASDG